MAAKLTRLTHKIAIQLHLVAESCNICSSRARLPVRKLLDTPSYIQPSNRVSFDSFMGMNVNTRWHIFTSYKNNLPPILTTPFLSSSRHVSAHIGQSQFYSIKVSVAHSVIYVIIRLILKYILSLQYKLGV
jgi:hypothetical protein